MSLKASDKAKTPEHFTDLKTENPPKNSAGLNSVKSAIGHANKYMNHVNAFKLSLKINQKKGFDCPGCSWPASAAG